MITDRAILFLVALALMIGALGTAVWLIVTGQLGTFDGNFILLCSLVIAAAFGLYLKYLLAAALQAPVAKKKPVTASQSKAA